MSFLECSTGRVLILHGITEVTVSKDLLWAELSLGAYTFFKGLQFNSLTEIKPWGYDCLMHWFLNFFMSKASNPKQNKNRSRGRVESHHLFY